jgi:putative SOS response-associated peptidase YedK
MCGRYTLADPAADLAERFSFDPADLGAEIAPRYNIAPSQAVLTVGSDRRARLLRWGLVTGDPKRSPINLRCEPYVRRLPRLRRCLVPADGFYEWRDLGGQRVPYRFQLRDGAPFAFAGLANDRSCAILTTAPNELVAPIHDRMPVILRRELEELWLDLDARDLAAAFVPYPAEAMAAYPVSRRVNNPRVDDAECIRPLA